MKNLSKGFTLIELLVVIAIIGILSGLIIVSMGGATNSAKDARIKSEMDQLRSTAIIYSNNNGTSGYGTATVSSCGATTDFTGDTTTGKSDGKTLLADITLQQPTSGTTACYITSSTFCIMKQLNSGTSGAVSNYWCIDSNGYSGNPKTTTQCTSSYPTCN
jgi:prepilin-type N-terminal cleavage/methylation domain-containing protein